MKKKLLTQRNIKIAIKIIDSILAALVLLFALRVLTVEDPDKYVQMNVFLMALLAISKLFVAFAVNKRNKLFFIRDLVCAAAFIVSIVLILVIGINTLIMRIIASIYFSTMLAERITSAILHRNVRSIVINVLASLLIVYIIFSALNVTEDQAYIITLLISLVITVRSLVHIIVVAFAEMRFKIILKIVRKTYAVEIMFGMLLLIVAFSFVLSMTEQNIPTFVDALWFCFAVVTTIGFGDYTAVSILGRTLTVILGVYGLIVVALITSIIVNFYNEVKNEADEKNVAPPEIEENQKTD